MLGKFAFTGLWVTGLTGLLDDLFGGNLEECPLTDM